MNSDFSDTIILAPWESEEIKSGGKSATLFYSNNKNFCEDISAKFQPPSLHTQVIPKSKKIQSKAAIKRSKFRTISSAITARNANFVKYLDGDAGCNQKAEGSKEEEFPSQQNSKISIKADELEHYRAFLALRAENGMYRPDSAAEMESYRQYLHENNYPNRANTASVISLQGISDISSKKLASTGRPETAVAKDFMCIYLAASGDDQIVRPDTAMAKLHYHSFLAPKMDKNVPFFKETRSSVLIMRNNLIRQQKKHLVESAEVIVFQKSPSAFERTKASQKSNDFKKRKSPRVYPSPENGSEFFDLTGNDISKSPQVSRPSTHSSSDPNCSLKSSPFINSPAYTSNTSRSDSRPSSVDSNSYPKSSVHSKPTIQLFPFPQLPISKHCAGPIIKFSSSEQTKDQKNLPLPHLISRYINRKRKTVRNRVTHGIPRKKSTAPTPHIAKVQKPPLLLTQPQIQQREVTSPKKVEPNAIIHTPLRPPPPSRQRLAVSQAVASLVLPVVVKKTIIPNATPQPTTRPDTQHRVRMLIREEEENGRLLLPVVTKKRGGGSGMDSWKTFQKCLETAKAMSDPAQPMSLLETAELVTQLWNQCKRSNTA
ncbi:hypothetical protein HK100_006412 [Physocladia obscura]|uniref:Uncharacterized protein n=1 Tax=Physocladia obscura TaxID=109957 RepID=A0AAD5XF70_9FUNG|nr:hypothetical protein HK100_006412 [Physocladia obscura]